MNIQNLIRPTIKALKPYSSARDEFQGVPSNMVFLDANENPFENGVNRYPDPYQNKVKSELSKIKGVPTDNILLGNGSDEVLDLIFRMFCEPYKDNVIILPPTYGMYEVLANLNAVALIKAPLNTAFQPEVDNILKLSNVQSKLLFLCSPNNPSGNSFSNDNVEYLLNNFKGIVVLDEAYIDFSISNSWLKRLNQFPNLIITQTLSKAYGMAGIRLGVCYASTEIISVLNNIKPPYNINELTQKKALEILKNQDFIKNQVSAILEQRDFLIHELKTINFVLKIYPSDANFILIKVDNANKRYQQLLDNHIVVRNRTNQPGCENCLRLTVGTKEETKTLITILKNIQSN
jgi:histidinol-phosphate aminotransferase